MAGRWPAASSLAFSGLDGVAFCGMGSWQPTMMRAATHSSHSMSTGCAGSGGEEGHGGGDGVGGGARLYVQLPGVRQFGCESCIITLVHLSTAPHFVSGKGGAGEAPVHAGSPKMSVRLRPSLLSAPLASPHASSPWKQPSRAPPVPPGCCFH